MVRRLLPLLLLALLIAGCPGGSEPAKERPAAVQMPAFSPALEGMQDFYRIEFLPDGYPGQRNDDGVWAHPIYGVYVLKDYLKQYEQRPSRALRAAIRTVAEAAVERMDPFRRGLVFWYEADPARGERLYRRHYSGLTQAYYAVELQRAAELLHDDRLRRAAARVFHGLLIPTERGGVRTAGPAGPGIAELPQAPEGWILNGWQSALVSLNRYADLAESQRARRFVRRSARAMARMLPLYDVPRAANSRYGLTGFVYVRALFDRRPEAIRGARLVVGDEVLPLRPRHDASRWQPHLVAKDLDAGTPTSRALRANVVLSKLDDNAVVIELEGAREAAVQAYVGRYDPLSSAPVEPRWVDIATVRVRDGRLRAAIPERTVDAIVYPTNFVKRIGDQQVNVYHSVHILRMRELAEITGIRTFDRWADRWQRYLCRWPKLYPGLKARNYGPGPSTADPADLCRDR